MKSKDDTKEEDKLANLYKLFIIIIAVWVLSYGIIVFLIKKWEDRGTFGDAFGAVNSLFSGLAFAGIIYTIFLQRRELKYQREELEQTREEFKTQNFTLKKQRFENTFFNLLSQHNRIIEGLYFQETGGSSGTIKNNFEAFRFAHTVLKHLATGSVREFRRINNLPPGDYFHDLKDSDMEKFLEKLIRKWYNENPHNFHLYFQSLKRILKFVHKSSLLDNEHERTFYTSLFKDQISYYERAIILYSGLIADDWLSGITYYIKTYKLLDGIDKRSLLGIHDKEIFDKWANPNEPIE